MRAPCRGDRRPAGEVGDGSVEASSGLWERGVRSYKGITRLPAQIAPGGDPCGNGRRPVRGSLRLINAGSLTHGRSIAQPSRERPERVAFAAQTDD